VRVGEGAPLVWLDASLGTAEDEEWAVAAACRDEDPKLFFGPNRFEPKRDRLQREAMAKAVCGTCPALEACRQYALTQGELYGVWGGLGEADRRTILARSGVLSRTA
jgi:WhiB family transcriptional regulator, redox-sensing transcriptional regulator